MPRARHAPRVRLYARNTAVVRGTSHAATSIAADVERRAATAHDGARATAAAPGCAAQIERVIRPPVNKIVRLSRESQLRRVRLPQQDAACSSQPRRYRRILIRHIVLATHRAARGDDALSVNGVLQRKRHSMQHALALAPCERGIRFRRLGPRTFRREHHHRVQRRVHLFDPRQVRVHQLHRRHILVLNRLRHASG